MEYCSNGELLNRLLQDGALSEKEGARIFHQLVSALLYMKQMGINHRDIKP